MSEKSILILGDAGTGKTHYAAQLMLRLESSGCAARYFRPPENVEPFKDAMRTVSSGRSAAHTTGENSRSVVLPIEFAGRARSLVEWPEYAGERLSHLVKQRYAGEGWTKAAQRSDAWMLFVRHDKFGAGRDMLNRPVSECMELRHEASKETVDWSPQAQLIELLQMMLFLRRASQRRPASSPRLAVALSLYDTLPGADAYKLPMEALAAYAPLLAAFVETNWQPASRFVVGLSALGRPLDPEKPDAEFIDRGPTENGWIVMPDGRKSPDLTWPLNELVEES
jgi:Double-GTPase 1